ncbi:MAG: hypothetical protein ABI969_16490 [bacterium]
MKISRVVWITVIGAFAVILFDAIASIASRALGFPYARASVGSYFLYLAIGFAAGRHAATSRARSGAIAAAIAGFADVSVGWAVSWQIGPGRPPSGMITPMQWWLVAVFVLLFAAAIGFFGGVVGARSRPVAIAPS